MAIVASRSTDYECIKLVLYRFPYVDTLKVLEKWGPGCHFFPDGQDIFLDDLEKLLISLSSSTDTPPILALFTEIPSNPLLVTVNLPRLRQLADRFGFPIVVDDTIGNFVNVDALKYVDIVVTSLTKSFSGRANVLGGRYDLFRVTFRHYPCSDHLHLVHDLFSA